MTGPDPKPLPTRRVASREEAEKVELDLIVHGHAFVDERGRRIDPERTARRKLYRPTGLDPVRMRDRRELLRARLKFRWCAACGQPSGSVHHVVQKGAPHFGDDLVENLVGLCGSGATGCHGAYHGNAYVIRVEPAHDSLTRFAPFEERRDAAWVAGRIGRHIMLERPDTVAYVLGKIGDPAGWEFLRRAYEVERD